jgi:hypothetical protein
MSGYLQRLTTSAAASPIHPVVRPMFSTATPQPAVDEAYHLKPSEGHNPDRRSDTATSPYLVTHADATRPLREPRSPVTRPVTPVVQPSAEPSLGDSDAPAAPDRAAGPPAHFILPPRPYEQSAGRARDIRQPEAPCSPAERPFVPLLEPIANADERATPQRDGPPPARFAPRGLARLTPSARISARAPDEVQIHIGRIEVTAVQPSPAPSPPAKLRRDAMSLADYLKQRNGRSS